MDSPRQTVFAARNGDRAAFDSLFARNFPRLVAFIRARVGGVIAARESAHDLAQSVCREALEGIDEFDFRGEDAFRRWLFVRAVRKISNRHRWLHREKRDAARDAVPALAEEDATGLLTAYATIDTPSRHASAKEQLELIESSLERLPDAQREAIALVRVAGLSYQETAEHLGRTESATRGLVMRGLARLSGLLDGSEIDG